VGATSGDLRATNLSKAFHARPKRVVALHDFTLQVRGGEFVCLLGPSGCGKSTFLNIAAGFVPATTGQLLLDGRPIAGPGPDRGVVFQEHALFPWLAVSENISFGLRMRGVPSRERRETVRQYIALMGLAGFERSFPKDLSGGMRQRVAIARALANDPKMLLMDEPFASLDAQTRRLMQDELIRVWQQARKTVLFVTHSIEEALLLSDRIAVMTARPGTIREIVSVDWPRPRDDTSPEFAAAKRHIGAMLNEEITQSFAVLGRNL
jgi:NitT/TauT family transport system ATP-binding protein